MVETIKLSFQLLRLSERSLCHWSTNWQIFTLLNVVLGLNNWEGGFFSSNCLSCFLFSTGDYPRHRDVTSKQKMLNLERLY